jgi:hypothetical protein
MASYDDPIGTLGMLDWILEKKYSTPTPHDSHESNHDIPQMTKTPSHVIAGFFIVAFLAMVVVGGMFVRKRLRNPIHNRTGWNSVPNQDIELHFRLHRENLDD